MLSYLEGATMAETTSAKLSDFIAAPQFIDRLGDSLPGLVYVYDLVEHRNVYANRSMTDLLGYTAEQVRTFGASILEAIIAPEDLPRVIAHHGRMPEVADGQVVEIEYRVRAADDSWRWLHSWESVLTRTAEGAPELLFGIAHDVTERVRTESDLLESQRLLAESEQRWRSIVENPFDFVVVIDRDYKYTFVNFVAPGVNPQELIGKATPFDFVSPSDHAVMRAAFEMVFGEGRPTSYEVHVPRLNKWYSSLIGPIRQGEVTHASILTREITTEKEMQEQTRRAEQQLQALELKLAQSAKLEAVGQLAGGIAHDFNNLLTGIGALASLLGQRLGPTHPNARDLEDLQHAVTRGAGLTRQLLAFSRQQTIEPTDIDLNVLLDDTARMLRRLIGEDVELECSKADAPLFVRCDRTQLEQILLNLVLNARDAVRERGRVSIALRAVHVDEAARREDPDASPGPHAQISVQDNGVGMDPGVMARIFEPFFTTKPIGSGTGLGLAMVYGIVRQNRGFIQVHSKPGVGTTFRIHLPICIPGAPAHIAPTRLHRGGDETILLIEDEELTARVTRRLLELLGYQVQVVTRGDDALRVIEAGTQFDLLLTDVRLPGMTGPELYRQVAKLRPGVPVVFMSGYTADLLADQGISEAGTLFLQKPYSHDELAAKIRAALDAGRG